MFPPKLRFALAVALAVSSLTFLAVTLNSAKTLGNSGTALFTAKVLRRKDKVKDKPSAGEMASLRSQTPSGPERKFEDEIPKHVPIKWKLKAEKEKKFKDLKNPGWYRDFELEVTNTSDKPIYHLALWLEYPEIDAGHGAPLGVPLRYGRMNFIYHNTRPLPTDVPIQPGETHVFAIPDSDRGGWEWHKKHENTPDPMKVLLQFGQISFGDGTGFDTLGAVPYPRKKRSSASPCREGPARMVAGGRVALLTEFVQEQYKLGR